MTEKEWLKNKSPEEMIEWITDPITPSEATRRQLYLIYLAFWNVWTSKITGDWKGKHIQHALGFIEGRLTANEIRDMNGNARWDLYHNTPYRLVNDLVRADTINDPGLRTDIIRDIVEYGYRQHTFLQVGDVVVAVPPYALICGSGAYSYAIVVSLDPFVLVSEQGDMLWGTMTPQKVRKLYDAAGVDKTHAFDRWDRDCRIYKKNGKTIICDPSWLEWQNGAVVKAAQTLYDGDDVAPGMGMLGDMLEDAGCTITTILDHCRSGIHAHGCWVLDFILDKR